MNYRKKIQQEIPFIKTNKFFLNLLNFMNYRKKNSARIPLKSKRKTFSMNLIHQHFQRTQNKINIQPNLTNTKTQNNPPLLLLYNEIITVVLQNCYYFHSQTTATNKT